jgi:hypothetical protein
MKTEEIDNGRCCPASHAPQDSGRIGGCCHRECSENALGGRPTTPEVASHRTGRTVAMFVVGGFLLLITAWTVFFNVALKHQPKQVPIGETKRP